MPGGGRARGLGGMLDTVLGFRPAPLTFSVTTKSLPRYQLYLHKRAPEIEPVYVSQLLLDLGQLMPQCSSSFCYGIRMREGRVEGSRKAPRTPR